MLPWLAMKLPLDLVMPSGAVLEGRGRSLQPKRAGLPGITRQRVGLPLKIFRLNSLLLLLTGGAHAATQKWRVCPPAAGMTLSRAHGSLLKEEPSRAWRKMSYPEVQQSRRGNPEDQALVRVEPALGTLEEIYILFIGIKYAV